MRIPLGSDNKTQVLEFLRRHADFYGTLHDDEPADGGALHSRPDGHVATGYEQPMEIAADAPAVVCADDL